MGAVAGGAGQGDACAAAVLRVLLPEGAGADEGHGLARVAVLLAQFFCGAAGKFGDGFLHLAPFGDDNTLTKNRNPLSLIQPTLGFLCHQPSLNYTQTAALAQPTPSMATPISASEEAIQDKLRLAKIQYI